MQGQAAGLLHRLLHSRRTAQLRHVSKRPCRQRQLQCRRLFWMKLQVSAGQQQQGQAIQLPVGCIFDSRSIQTLCVQQLLRSSSGSHASVGVTAQSACTAATLQPCLSICSPPALAYIPLPALGAMGSSFFLQTGATSWTVAVRTLSTACHAACRPSTSRRSGARKRPARQTTRTAACGQMCLSTAWQFAAHMGAAPRMRMHTSGRGTTASQSLASQW